MRVQQRVLGACEVVLRQLRDALEEPAPLGVVEVTTRQPAGRLAEPANDRLREGRPGDVAHSSAFRISLPTSAIGRRDPALKIVCTLPAPSPAARGTMWTWTCGTVCPVAAPLLMPIVLPAPPTASRTGPDSRCTARKRAAASEAGIASIVATWLRGTTTV